MRRLLNAIGDSKVNAKVKVKRRRRRANAKQNAKASGADAGLFVQIRTAVRIWRLAKSVTRDGFGKNIRWAARSNVARVQYLALKAIAPAARMLLDQIRSALRIWRLRLSRLPHVSWYSFSEKMYQ